MRRLPLRQADLYCDRKKLCAYLLLHAINIGLPILESVEASERIDDKDEVEINFDTGEIINKTKNETYQAQPFPARLFKTSCSTTDC